MNNWKHLAKTMLLAIGISATALNSYAFAAEGQKPVQPSRTTPTKPSYDRGDKDFDNAEETQPTTSRFRRRADYREEEKQKAKDAEQAHADAVKQAKESREEQLLAVKKRVNESVAANNKGVALGEQHHWAEAIAAHETAVQLDPSNKQFRINLSAARVAFGQERLAAGDFGSAAAMFRKALTAAPDNSLAGKLLTESIKKQGRDPSSAETRMLLGDQLVATGDAPGAAIEYQAAMQLEPSARTYTKVGDIALRYGQTSTAINWYRQALSKDGNYGPAFRQLGLLAYAQKNFTDAASMLRKAIIADAKDSTAGEALLEIWRKQVSANASIAENHLGLAGAMQLTGDFSGAEQEYRTVQTLDPQNPGVRAGLASLDRAMRHSQAEKHRAAAQVFFNQGLQREALSEVTQATMMEPKNARFQFLLAECLEANGDYNGAHQAYLTCVLIDPENNREAAARLKEMELNAGSHGAPQAQSSVPPPAISQSTKNIYEDIPENKNQTQVRLPSPQSRHLEDKMAKIGEAEAGKDFETAIDLLGKIIAGNPKNADLHHRLAGDLLSAGHEDEALAELRLAANLQPTNQKFADDLAQATARHKRAMLQEQPNSGIASSGGETAR